MKRTLLALALFLSPLFADNCTQTEIGLICCNDGSHAEAQAIFKCFLIGEQFYCYQVYDCVPDSPPPVDGE